MNDTVAIALITSLSTLSAAGITGSIGAWISRNQTSNQQVVAREERAEQRATRRSQLLEGSTDVAREGGSVLQSINSEYRQQCQLLRPGSTARVFPNDTA